MKVNEIYREVQKMTDRAIYLALDAAEIEHMLNFANGLSGSSAVEVTEARINVYNTVLNQRGLA